MATCINPNTKFYTTLKNERGMTDIQISDFNLKIESVEFNDWYGKGKRDSYGYPDLHKGLYLVNDTGKTISVWDLLNTDHWNNREARYSDITALEKLEKTLQNLNIGLRKRISAYRGSNYAKDLEKLLEEIDQLNDTNAVQALEKHTIYILRTLQQFEDRLFYFDDTDTSQLNESQIAYKKEQELNFLLQAEQFLSTFDQLKNLEEFKERVPGANLVIKLLKKAESQVTDVNGKVQARLKDMLVDRFKDLSTNPEILSGGLDFLAATDDETFMQRFVDSLGDTHHPVLAAMDKKYKRALWRATQEIKDLSLAWENLVNKYGWKTEKDLEKFIDPETGKFLESFDKERWNDERYYYLNRLKLLEKQGKKWFDEKHWLDEYKNLYNEYKQWKKVNAIETVDPMTGAKKVTPSSKWLDKRYQALSATDQRALSELKTFLSKVIAGTEESFVSKGYIPSFSKLLKSPEKQSFEEHIISEGGDIIKFLSMRHVHKLEQQATKNLKDIMTVEELEEYEKQVKENRKAHGTNVNKNLIKTMPVFIKNSRTYFHKKNIENDVKLVNSQLKHLMITATDAKSKPIIDKLASIVKGDKVKHELPFIEGRLWQHWNDWLEGVYYEEFTKDEGKLTEVVDNIQNISSFTAIGFNILSAINNKIVGNIQAKIEAAGGQYFNVKEYFNARKMYFSTITAFIADRNTEAKNTLLGALIHRFDILQDKSELTGKPNGIAETILHKAKMLKDMGYFMQHIGEHQVQNTVLISMLQSHRIVDGKVMSFFEYVQSKAINADVKKMQEEGKSAEEIKDFINNNLPNKKELEKEFSQYAALIDAYELKDGSAKLKNDIEVNETEIADFTEKVKAVNQKLHGAYNLEDGAMLQRYALGRLGMQFRKWLPNAWNRRFGAKFGKSYWNERRKEYNEGYYITFGKFVGNPFVKTFKDYKTWKERLTLKAAKDILKGYKDFITNMKIHWHSLDELEKANVKRTTMEFALLAGIIALGYLLKGAGDDDDDKNKLLIWSLYESDRLFGELSMFTPFGVLREGSRLTKNPFAVFRTFENIGKLLENLVLYPFRDEEGRLFKSGIYHGRDKVSVYFLKSTPVINQLQNLLYLSENNQRYGMFK